MINVALGGDLGFELKSCEKRGSKDYISGIGCEALGFVCVGGLESIICSWNKAAVEWVWIKRFPCWAESGDMKVFFLH